MFKSRCEFADIAQNNERYFVESAEIIGRIFTRLLLMSELKTFCSGFYVKTIRAETDIMIFDLNLTCILKRNMCQEGT